MLARLSRRSASTWGSEFATNVLRGHAYLERSFDADHRLEGERDGDRRPSVNAGHLSVPSLRCSPPRSRSPRRRRTPLASPWRKATARFPVDTQEVDATLDASTCDVSERLLPDPDFGDALFVGSFWTKDNRVEVDLVGGREPTRAQTIDFVGSIKWNERTPFDRAELAALNVARARVAGATPSTRLVGVSRSGFSTPGIDLELDPSRLLDAWDLA